MSRRVPSQGLCKSQFSFHEVQPPAQVAEPQVHYLEAKKEKVKKEKTKEAKEAKEAKAKTIKAPQFLSMSCGLCSDASHTCWHQSLSGTSFHSPPTGDC